MMSVRVILTIVFMLCHAPVISVDASEMHSGAPFVFKTKANRHVLPLVKAHQYDSLCSALLADKSFGKPVYVQTGRGDALGCQNEEFADGALGLFGASKNSCTEEIALRNDEHLGRGSSWGDLFDTPASLQQSGAIALRPAYRMFTGGQSGFQTSYLLMRLPLSGKSPAQRQKVLADADICSDTKQREKVAEAVNNEKFIVFDPYAPARSVFIFDDLNTPVRLFFSDDPARNLTDVQQPRDASVERPAWANRIYRVEWSQRGTAYSSVIVPARPSWLVQAEKAEHKKAPVVFHTDGERGRVIVQFPTPIAHDVAPGAAAFTHFRLVLPFDEKLFKQTDRTREIDNIVDQLIPGGSANRVILAVDQTSFDALRQTSLDASFMIDAGRPAEPPAFCNDLPRDVFFRANSPYSPFGDAGPYVFRTDTQKRGIQDFIRNYCTALDVYQGGSNDPYNGPTQYYEWFDQKLETRLSNVTFSTEQREVRLLDKKNRKVSGAIASSYTTKLEAYPDENLDPKGYDRPILKFVLVDGPTDGSAFYAQDFSVSLDAALKYFSQNTDVTFFVNAFLGGHSYEGTCYNEVFNIKLLDDSIDPAKQPEKHRISVYTAAKLSEFLTAHTGDHWKFLVNHSGDSKECQRERYLIYASENSPTKGTIPKAVLDGIKDAELTEDQIKAELEKEGAVARYDSLASVVDRASQYLKDMSRDSTRPMALLTDTDALRIVHGLLGLRFVNGNPEPSFTMYGQRWKLANFSEDAFRSLVDGKWPLYSPYGTSGNKLGDSGDPTDVPYADDSTSHFVPTSSHRPNSWHYWRQFGLHGLLPGPIIRLRADDEQFSYPKHDVSRALNDLNWTVFSARLMFVQDREEDPE